jgi:hypothetical protein
MKSEQSWPAETHCYKNHRKSIVYKSSLRERFKDINIGQPTTLNSVSFEQSIVTAEPKRRQTTFWSLSCENVSGQDPSSHAENH